ncbi:hypothetical protein [Nocardiopsis sp. L17-MgMaSL7]|uniref:hypothetical protein n=1 Tax=Nocardiopsis sp. L17-MgMaSL7 TaxID=1938893 RepID=UPI000D861CCC|nr:hypothetical protein [Nocardiopsis sp. L17-MgMaSL7]PWV57529.1 hypothetical protein BDW27_102400 [Nocardiopsis sp. L17-MgMaSL7]
MDFAPSPRATDLVGRVRTFVETGIEPVEEARQHDPAALRADGDPWRPLPVVDEHRARARRLWNLFPPAAHEGPDAERLTDGPGEAHRAVVARLEPVKHGVRR